MNKKVGILLLFGLIVLMSFSVSGATISDDFNDNNLSSSIWNGDFYISEGELNITETNERLEMTSIGQIGSCNYNYTWIQTLVPISAGEDGYFQIDYKALKNFTTAKDVFYVVVGTNTTDGLISATDCGVHFQISGTLRRTYDLQNNIILNNYAGAMDSDTHTLKVVVTRGATFTDYAQYEDGVWLGTNEQTGDCSDQSTDMTIVWCPVNHTGTLDENKELVIFDDYISETSLNVNGSGAGCNYDADCECGFCDYGFCRLGLGTDPCDDGACCLSGVCSNNKCTKPPIVDQLEMVIGQNFGDDPMSLNFISLIFMIGLPVAIILSGKSFVAVLAGIVIYYGLTFFFALIGWLSPFILVGSVVAGLIVVVLAFVMGVGGE